jgi:type VI secretion system secreted protein VgrG
MSESIEYKFISRALDSEETFSVIDFKGTEGLSRNYEYTINLKSLDFDIDLDAVLNKQCLFKRNIGETKSIITGILSRFEQLHQVEDYVLYKAVLVPSLWKLSLYHTNEVYLDMSVPDIIEAVLKETGFHPTIDYELKLNGTYEKWAYRCQYGENHLSFIKRLMEHEGIYYYFEQSEDGEKVIFCDNMQNHVKVENSNLSYSPVSGLDITEGYSNLHSFICKHKRMPKKVILKDYNYEKPSLDVEGEAVVDDNGIGEVFIYGENFNTPEEGAKYAKVRSQELLCTKKRFYGEGIVNQISAGYLFSLKGHFREKFNMDFLVTEIEHEGSAPSYLTDSSDINDVPQAYMNTFTAIPSNIQFRPKRETEKPKFYGTINAIIDAEGEGQYSEIDDQGRYKVVLPFDRVKRGDSGKASCWIRMAQPYSGTTEGMHFPLRKGTEVLLTFINGDPDQPIISGAVPNAAQPSVVTGENQTNNMIRSAAGNLIEMEDKENNNRIKLSTPQNSTYFHLGAPNASGSGIVSLTDGIERKVIGGGQQITVFSSITDADQMTDSSGTSSSSTEYGTPGDNAKKLMYSENSASAPTGANGHQFNKKDIHGKNINTTTLLDPLTSTTNGELSGEFVIERRKGPRYLWSDGNDYIFNVKNDSSGDNKSINKTFVYGNTWNENHSSEIVTAEKFDVLADDRTIKATADKKPATYANLLKGDAWENDKETLKVDKSFCDSYSYTKGDSLEIVDGNSHKIKVGHGNDVEVHYDTAGIKTYYKDDDKEEKWKDGTKVFYEEGDVIKKWTDSGTKTYEQDGDDETKWTDSGTKIFTGWSSGNASKETTYDSGSGALATISNSSSSGGSVASFDMSFSAKASAEFNFGVSSSFSLSTSASAAIEIGASASFKLELATAFNIEISFNPAWKYELDDGAMKLSGPGTAVTKKAELMAELQSLSLKKTLTELDNTDVVLTNDSVKAKAEKLGITTVAGIKAIL